MTRGDVVELKSGSDPMTVAMVFTDQDGVEYADLIQAIDGTTLLTFHENIPVEAIKPWSEA